MKIKVKLQFSAPSAGIIDVATRLSNVRFLVRTRSGRAQFGVQTGPPDCPGCKVRGLHGCTTTQIWFFLDIEASTAWPILGYRFHVALADVIYFLINLIVLSFNVHEKYYLSVSVSLKVQK